MSSETPNDRAPMKSFLVVRSQSHTSIDSLRSLSEGFSLLQAHIARVLTKELLHLLLQKTHIFTVLDYCL